jgi:hypothetical protein
MTRATVTVTQEDIDKGIRGSDEHCPIALATRRALGAPFVVVDCSSITLRDEGQNIYAETETPCQACLFVHDFDAGQPVKPITLELTFTPIEP